MQSHTVNKLLIAIVGVLLVLAIVQFIQLGQQSTSAEVLKAEILAELRGGSPQSQLVPGEPDLGLPEPTDAISTSTSRKTPIREIEPPATALSTIEYWISTDYSDENPSGFTAWIELVRGGHFLLEQCFAPDYSKAIISAEDIPFESPHCKTLTDTRIQAITDSELVLVGDKKMTMKLDTSGEVPFLTLELDGDTLAMSAGQKNTLWEGLSALPSVQKASKAAWSEHVKLREQPVE